MVREEGGLRYEKERVAIKVEHETRLTRVGRHWGAGGQSVRFCKPTHAHCHVFDVARDVEPRSRPRAPNRIRDSAHQHRADHVLVLVRQLPVARARHLERRGEEQTHAQHGAGVVRLHPLHRVCRAGGHECSSARLSPSRGDASCESRLRHRCVAPQRVECVRNPACAVVRAARGCM
eukprot:6207570-Pleurochrysis_carterae.AAC.2